MRVLTAEEVGLLIDGTLPEDVDEVPDPPGSWSPACVQDLSRRGLLTWADCGHFIRLDTTPRGQLALRCHRAYLESVGAGR